MIERIIRLSVDNKLAVGILVIGLVLAGIYSFQRLPIDAVPDITNNQVQVVTSSTSLAAQEVEQFITYPVEVAVANIPNVTEIRSISRFGLSVVTIVFEDWVPILEARQYVKEQIGVASENIPAGMGSPELMPITTGLGEIYQYVLRPLSAYEDVYDAMKLRTIQDWIVKRQLAGTPGIIEVSSFGGYLKQYEIALDPLLLQSADVTITEVFEALSRNNQNTGGSYIEKNNNAYYIRTEGQLKTLSDIELIPVANHNGIPVHIKDVGQVGFGSPQRFGAMTMDGQGETVGGITLMLKGGNSSEAINNVHERIEQIKKSLPEGLELYPYLDRSTLVAKAIGTVRNNLLEGGVIVILVLVLLLGNLRAGLIVASVIPLAMLFAIILMNYFGVSANLMSLGAIDFGIVVDGAVIVVEGVIHTLFTVYLGKQLTQAQMDNIIVESSAKLFRSAVFGVFIILVVFIPIMTLTGIEGKMFRPMAMTFSFAVLGALLLSLTYVPAISALILPKNVTAKYTLADRLMDALKRVYQPALDFALRNSRLTLVAASTILVISLFVFRSLGAVFIPTLEEGDLAMQMAVQPGSSLHESIRTTTKAERVLLDNFPEVKHVVSKIGTAEVPTDPMAIEDADIMIILKERSEWTSANNREELADKMKEKLAVILGASFEFTQPIQLRFNELMTGAKTDIAIKIFGENTEVLKQYADQAARLITEIPGVGDVKVDQTEGLPQWLIRFKRDKLAQYGVDIESINNMVRTAYAGEVAGTIFENERKFDLVVRLNAQAREQLNLDELFLHLPNEQSIPLSELASIEFTEGPMQISRESAKRRITVGVNVRQRDIASLVEDIQIRLDEQLNLPAGYSLSYGGVFENLQQAIQRLSIAVPAALLLILTLLYLTFGRVKYALMIFTAVPLSAIGGVLALWLRGMPFSISAGVGFIALFGVAVLNGIVLISQFNQLRTEGAFTDWRTLIVHGSLVRLRPVIMTATVAALGFLPMALSVSNGAEVQRPLATVVIGGLITATFLTLIILPVLYYLTNRKHILKTIPVLLLGVIFHLFVTPASAQGPILPLDSAVETALTNHPSLEHARLEVSRNQLGINAAKERPPLEVQLQTGQINTNLLDYNLSVSQGLGNLRANQARRSLAESQTAQATAEQELLTHQLVYQVKQAWYRWYYSQKEEDLIEQQVELLTNAKEKAQLRHQLGEIDQLELSVIENQLLSAKRLLNTARLQRQANFQQLAQIAWLQGDFRTPDEAPLLEIPIQGLLLPQLLEAEEQAVKVAQQEESLSANMLRPGLSLGYFLQSIRPDYSFQGITLGLSLPLYQKSQKAQIAQANIRAQQATNRLNQTRFRLKQEQQLALQQWQLVQLEWTEQTKELPQQAAQIQQLAELQLRNGAIDYFRYVQSMKAALESQIAYVQLEARYQFYTLQAAYYTQSVQ